MKMENSRFKLRAWDIEKNKFLYPKLWDNSMPSNWEKHYILSQFTGLHDKNGKEIYEGDMLNIGSLGLNGFGFVKDGDGNNAIYIVKCELVDYTLKRIDLSITWGRLSRLDELGWECEVIGNVFENPELLSDKH